MNINTADNILSHKNPRQLAIKPTDSPLTQLQDMANNEIDLADDMDVADIFSPNRAGQEFNVWTEYWPRVAVLTLFDTTVFAVQRTFDTVVRRTLPMRKSYKLTKNVAASAVRKSIRTQAQGLSRFDLLVKTSATSLRGSALYWSALFLVSVGFDAADTLRLKKPIFNWLVGARPPIKGGFSRRAFINFSRCFVGWLCASAGAGLGSLVKPGVGTTIGSIVFSTIAISAIS